MTTKYDQAYDCLYDGLREIEQRGYLDQDQLDDLKEIISDTLNDMEADEDKEQGKVLKATAMGEEGV